MVKGFGYEWRVVGPRLGYSGSCHFGGARVAEQLSLFGYEPEAEEPKETDPYVLGMAEVFVEGLEKQFADGDRLALFHAIATCAQYRLIVPPWAAGAFIERFDPVYRAEISSWDEAFGRPYPKGAHLEKLRRWRFDCEIYMRIQNILEWRPGEPAIAAWLTERGSIGPWLFEMVGTEFRIGSRKCKDLYYEQKKRVARPFWENVF